MFKWFKSRLSEKTTYLALGTTVLGLGQLFKAHEAPQIAETIAQAAEPLASGDYAAGVATLALGVLGVFMKEKGSAE